VPPLDRNSLRRRIYGICELACQSRALTAEYMELAREMDPNGRDADLLWAKHVAKDALDKACMEQIDSLVDELSPKADGA